ncbi:olfactory receptor 6J1-like [Trichosurus vulpecula]|uniref:olfactory receptor 6J1-like n=1 Tax=Trichosurus vulpecula TaxID=9337 RepID=UPI00186B4C88|nr:olfactory receptor 6J1-like [Trichosurus vulpecula]
MENQTTVTKFILLGFPINRKAELLFFMLLLPMYVMTLLGNILIIYIVVSHSRLYTPMYFFLCDLSTLDILFTSVISPRILDNLATGDKSISFAVCITQCYFYFFLGTVEFLLLTSMSYDWHAAICNPLRYNTIMSPSVCIGLVLFSWVGGFSSVLFPTVLISRLPFCGSNIINHYFCDGRPLLALACTDTTSIELMDFLLSSAVIIFSIILTGYSYACIIITILHIPSATGKKKAFNTCASHLTIVVIAGGITAFIYATPSQKETLEMNKIPSVLSSVVAPFLNPFIYTLRNDTVQGILREVWSYYMVPERSDKQVESTKWAKCSQWAKDIRSCCLSPQETQDQAEREQKYKCLHLMEELAGLMLAGEVLHNEMDGCQGSVSPTTKSLLDFWQRLSSQLDEDHPIHHTPHYYHRRLHSLLWVYGNSHDRSTWRRRE